MTVNISGDTGVSQVQAGAIEVTDIPNNTITGNKIVDDAITVNKLHTQVQGALGTRNLIINGDMHIAQRGTSATGITNGGYFTVDRFAFYPNILGTWTNTQSTDVPSGQGFSNSYKLECTTADASPAAGDLITIQHRIEAQNCQYLNYGTSSAKTTTLSFWVKSNKTGTYNFHLRKDDDNRRIVKQYTISSADTWEKKTITMEGDTSGAINNDNGVGLQLTFWLGAGSDYTTGSVPTGWGVAATTDYASSQVNLADSTSNYFNLTGVQLEIGDTATPFEHRPFDMELVRCQRYFCKSYNYTDPVGTNTWVGTISERNYDTSSRTEIPLDVNFPVRMRTTPTLTAYSKTGISGNRTSGSTALDSGTSETTAITLYGSETNIRGTDMAVALNAAIWLQCHYTADAEL